MSEAINNAQLALSILKRDLPRLERIERYERGEHDDPYMPESAGDEYRLLAERATTNWLSLVVDATAQALIVDSFRRQGEPITGRGGVSEDWKHWQASRLDAGQSGIFRGALIFGQSFILTEKVVGGAVRSRGISPLRTVALYEDPTFDIDPKFAVYIRKWGTGDEPGILWAWDETYKYVFRMTKTGGKRDLVLAGRPERHGAKHCPVTRVPCYTDLEGNTTGLVEPLIPIQDRTNQTVFDLLVAQSYTSFEVRTVTGQAPPVKMTKDQNGNATPLLDEAGNPVPDLLVVNAARWMYAEDPDVKFGHLPAGDLNSLIAAIELSQRHLSAIAQVPPHYMLGQISNVNAEGLNAAAVQLARKNGEIASQFGEALERMFRIAAEMRGEDIEEGDFGEVSWRDLSNNSIAQTADALGKFADQLGIPRRGLWNKIPGVTQSELDEWERLYQEERPELGLNGVNFLNDDLFSDEEGAEVNDPYAAATAPADPAGSRGGYAG